MTRAMERLFLTSANYRMMYGQGDYTRESVFLRELDPRVLDTAGDAIYVPSRKTDNTVGVFTGSLEGFAQPAYKPYYDPLQHAKKVAKANAAGGSDDFAPGDAVRHGKVGTGIVLEQDDKTITVMFDTEGRKKLAKGFAPLTKL